MNELMEEMAGNYEDYKNQLREELAKTADGFIRIGFLLKVARDTDVLSQSKYSNYIEFAEKEFGLDKTQVSRFININDRFSEGGNSDRIRSEWRGYGSAKLSIMLTLPESVNEVLSPEMTKAEIQAVKEEVEEEKKVSDIEVMMEGEKESAGELENDLQKVLYQLLEDDPELFVSLRTGRGVKYADIMAPDGEKVYSVRVQGRGRFLLTINAEKGEYRLVNIREDAKQEIDGEDFDLDLESVLFRERIQIEEDQDDVEYSRSAWADIYGRDFPKKEEVAPVQPEKKKESKVQKAPKKTEAQKYNEKQAKIDRETKKKLEEMEDEAFMNAPLPSEQLLNGDTYEVKTAPTYFEAAMSGAKQFELRKNDRNYQAGRKLLQKEFKENEYTGRELLQEITFLLEDYTGLEDGYCILGVKNLDLHIEEKQIEGKMEIEDLEELDAVTRPAPEKDHPVIPANS